MQNWFPNIIGTPELVSRTCLLLNETLLPEEFGNCTTMTGRAYNTFIVPAHQVGVLTGANALDVAKVCSSFPSVHLQFNVKYRWELIWRFLL
jgi:hypothetical protein